MVNNSSIISTAPLPNTIKNVLSEVGFSTPVSVLAKEGVWIDELLKKHIDVVLVRGNELPYPLHTDVEVLAVISDFDFDKFDFNNKWVAIGLANNLSARNLFNSIDERQSYGTVSIGGFGAGDHELMTVKVASLIQSADTIFYDDLISNDYLDKVQNEKIYVGKRKGNHSCEQEEINHLLYKAAIEGKTILRLKGGDPLIFGRGAEEFHYLQRRLISAQIIPGITAAFAGAAQFAIPLTHREHSSSVAFVSGHNVDKMAFPKAQTLVVYMGASNQKAIAQKLILEGWPSSTPVVIIKEASLKTAQKHQTTLSSLAQTESGLTSPLILIVGEVARPEGTHPPQWLYTGVQVTDYKSDKILVHSPMISINEVEFNDTINQVIANINSYNYLIFTSKYAVNHFFRHLYHNQKDSRHLSHATLLSMGDITSSELKKHGLIVPPLPGLQSTNNLIQHFKNEKEAHQVLIPSAVNHQSKLQEEIGKLGHNVTLLPVYTNTKPSALLKHDLTHFEGVIFTSPSTIRNFIELYGTLPKHLKIEVRGAESKNVLNQYGISALS